MRRLFLSVLLPAFFLFLLIPAGCRDVSDRSGDVLSVTNSAFFAQMKPYLLSGYSVSLIAKGHSMLPTIQDNVDVVTLERAEQYMIGDVVLAELPEQHYVLHRIVRIEGDSVTLRGDNNKGVEHTVMERILAKMTALEHDGALRASVNPAIDPLASYRIAPQYRLDGKAGQYLMVDTVSHHIDMHHMVMMNESAQLIYDGLRNKLFRLNDMVKVLTDAYDVDSVQAENDCTQLLGNWVQYGLAEKSGD